MLLVSGFFMCAAFLPFLYSVVIPNEDLQRLASALEGRDSPPLDSETVVQQAIAALGTLKRTIKVGHFYGAMTKTHYAPPQTFEKIKVSQGIYVAWFEKRPEPILVAFACYTKDDGQKGYQISAVSPLAVARNYLIPLCFFGLSLFLVRKRKSSASAQSYLR